MVDDSRDLFLESPGNFSGPESWLLFPRLAIKIKFSIILKMVEWNYKLAKQKPTGLRARNCATLQQKNLLSAPKGTGRSFEKQTPSPS